MGTKAAHVTRPCWRRVRPILVRYRIDDRAAIVTAWPTMQQRKGSGITVTGQRLRCWEQPPAFIYDKEDADRRYCVKGQQNALGRARKVRGIAE